ncbi:hypothetical protein KY290_027249 [Solanum tuberosum]|uniref:Integrase core domain containing protein n=1 Tax=Solanum tuberosum TaxID=4113 RepID=A0ABQ7UEL2_SOLTU|nr:hypothetical protein KY290_027249 [Solanum tuberosum]
MGSTMPSRRKNATKPAPLLLLNQRVMTIPKQSEEGGSRSGSIAASSNESNAGSGSQFTDNSGGSAGSENEDVEITDDDTMVMYVPAHEPDPAVRPKGIVIKNGSFKSRAIMPESRVVVANIKAFPDINRTFQFHQFDWMNNALGEYSFHLTREFYSSYAATLMNFTAETETTKRGQRNMAITWRPLNSGKHHEVTSDTTMEIYSSREKVLCWIAKKIAIDGENAVWVTTMPTLIT